MELKPKIRGFFSVKRAGKGTMAGEVISKAKIGSFIIGLAALLGTGGAILSGSVSFLESIPTLMAEVGAVFAVFGITELPVLN